MLIIDSLSLLATTVHLEHVKGHQDDSLSQDELPWTAQLNVRCDELATAKLERSIKLGSYSRPTFRKQ
jgi:hypothetical protein